MVDESVFVCLRVFVGFVIDCSIVHVGLLPACAVLVVGEGLGVKMPLPVRAALGIILDVRMASQLSLPPICTVIAVIKFVGGSPISTRLLNDLSDWVTSELCEGMTQLPGRDTNDDDGPYSMGADVFKRRQQVIQNMLKIRQGATRASSETEGSCSSSGEVKKAFLDACNAAWLYRRLEVMKELDFADTNALWSLNRYMRINAETKLLKVRCEVLKKYTVLLTEAPALSGAALCIASNSSKHNNSKRTHNNNNSANHARAGRVSVEICIARLESQGRSAWRQAIEGYDKACAEAVRVKKAVSMATERRNRQLTLCKIIEALQKSQRKYRDSTKQRKARQKETKMEVETEVVNARAHKERFEGKLHKLREEVEERRAKRREQLTPEDERAEEVQARAGRRNRKSVVDLERRSVELKRSLEEYNYSRKKSDRAAAKARRKLESQSSVNHPFIKEENARHRVHGRLKVMRAQRQESDNYTKGGAITSLRGGGFKTPTTRRNGTISTATDAPRQPRAVGFAKRATTRSGLVSTRTAGAVSSRILPNMQSSRSPPRVKERRTPPGDGQPRVGAGGASMSVNDRVQASNAPPPGLEHMVLPVTGGACISDRTPPNVRNAGASSISPTPIQQARRAPPGFEHIVPTPVIDGIHRRSGCDGQTNNEERAGSPSIGVTPTHAPRVRSPKAGPAATVAQRGVDARCDPRAGSIAQRDIWGGTSGDGTIQSTPWGVSNTNPWNTSSSNTRGTSDANPWGTRNANLWGTGNRNPRDGEKAPSDNTRKKIDGEADEVRKILESCDCLRFFNTSHLEGMSVTSASNLTDDQLVCSNMNHVCQR